MEKLRSISPTAVVPVPQTISRSWALRGSPPRRIAEWVASELGIPLVDALEKPRFSGPRQAELHREERASNPLRFRLVPDELGAHKSVILVDDFRTTGHTLKAAALELERGGVRRIHGFCLGLRLPRIELRPEAELAAQLVESA